MLIILSLIVLTVAGYALHYTLDRKTLGRLYGLFRSHSDRRLDVSKTTVSDTKAVDLVNSFPPSRRHALPDLGRTTTAKFISPTKLLPDKQPADPTLHQDHSTATGITLREIHHLGDFPDYATLSGVPLPEPYPDFDIAKALPRPYRPFRWSYHQTMSYQKLDPNWWLELDKNYTSTLKLRASLFETHGPEVLQVLPGAELAAKELMEMCIQFLCARYPKYFHLSQDNAILHNKILDTEINLRTTAPFHVLLQTIPEDFALMLRDPATGLYTFRGGIIMSSLGWSLGSKIGMQLSDIHSPVPDYAQKMKFSMDRYFARMATDKPIQRGSWGIEVGTPLFMAPGDPHEKEREVQNPAHTIEDMHLRVDWQTLRRLPLSGAVVFNFKGLFTPITEFRDEPRVPSLVLKILREGKKSIMDYKSTWHTEHVVIPALEKYEKEQIEKGVMRGDWEPQTLEENPFFPGWREKWEQQQGF